MKFHITKFSPVFYYLPLPRPRYLPQHRIVRHPQLMFLCQCKRDQFSHPHKTAGKICISAAMHVFCLSPVALYEVTSLCEEHALAVCLNTSRCACYGPVTKESKRQGVSRCELELFLWILLCSKYSRFQIGDAGCCWNRADAARWAFQLP